MGVKRRRITAAAGWLAFAAVAAVNLDTLIVQWTLPTPPARPRAAILREELRDEEGVRGLGPCWFTRHRDQNVLYIEGDPFTLGYCNSRLTDAVMYRQEKALLDALERLVPVAVFRHILKRGVMIAYRNLPDHFTEAEKLEVLGIAAGYRDRLPFLGPTYARILAYHAIHDVSQALVDNPLVACSSFAASGQRTRDGHTLLARNFDFEGGRVFDEDKIVLFVRPDLGIPFVSVAWGGMVGVVTGMNAEGIGIVINAAGSDERSLSGRPSTLVVRDVLQTARSLEEAIDVIRGSPFFVTDILTLADGNTGDVAVVEVTPARVEVRRSGDRIVATNHLLRPAFSEDRENFERKKKGTTVARLERLTELVLGAGPLDPRSAIAILRDRKGPGGAPRAMGHRGTIDALIATHSIVFDLTARRLWVSSAPHTLGEYVEYDLGEVLRGRWRDRGALPRDELLTNGGWERYRRASELIEEAERLDDEGDAGEAIERAREALGLVPNHPVGLLRLGEICDDAGRADCARESYRAFLAADPPHRRDADLARRRLSALTP